MLRDRDGVAFMAGVHPLADLAPRDVVSRAIHQRMRETGTDHVYLDASMIDDFANHFPTIWRACQSVGLDPTRELLPVAPAAHYLSGGVVDRSRRRDARCRGCGRAVRPRAAACTAPTGSRRIRCSTVWCSAVASSRRSRRAVSDATRHGAMTGILDVATIEPEPVAIRSCRAPDEPSGDGDPEKLRSAIQRTMSTDCGVVRDAAGLAVAAKTLARARRRSPATSRRMSWPTARCGTSSGPPARSCSRRRRREESRGAHTRADFPETSDAFRGRIVLRGDCRPGVRAAAVLRARRVVVTDFDPPAPYLHALVAGALAEDLGLLGDITSIACIDADSKAEAAFVAARSRRARRHRGRDRGVPAGRSGGGGRLGARRRRAPSQPASTLGRVRGSDAFDPHRRARRAEPPLALLRHRVDDASLRRRRAGDGVRILDTRKTLPGLRALQRAAVRAGGGFNHRDSLSDAVLIKDNHLAGRGAPAARSNGRARVGPAASSRSSATRSSRCRKRATPAPTSCCSTT